MSLSFTPLHPLFMAEVNGADLTKPLPEDQAAEIGAAMDRYAVLVFRDQDIDDAQQIAFGTAFGPLEAETATVDADKRRLQHAQMNDISNLDEKGQLLAADDRRRMFALGNRLWHSDSSFKSTPARYSLLHGRVVPPEGGETEFADMRAAWDALDAKSQDKLRDLVCDHSLLFSRGLLGFSDYTDDERRKWEPVPQRLVRRHEGSGRLSLYLSAHIGRIHGWPVPEAMAMIRDLMEHATQREFVYRHNWRRQDLLMWDNRCSMHRARPFEDRAYPRDLRRVTIQDSRPTLEQAAA
ncbi:alpha-ketoglutarate-dependent 2,4-dichlorophenoxyacetate dioxygenase [Humitalea rosea]|uniref:Alpha-ketoglutarate-dependent 2,4-dichlorophenoxyacetate dioxygenase n=1 Tax=Humitalea rosea TaxID=990373 RepID=A0A2W7JU17_9PROT|nr:TauD/TfdA family dioxygenase [Humitalea rosea]PZW38950.1 alpha-ketoglutarate-dependent 2,4-dichlorophenoxyacetate dioxygenase [Humitalea rosea]